MYQLIYSIFLSSLLGSVTKLLAQTNLSPYWDMQSLSASYTITPGCVVTELKQGNNFGNTIFLSDASASSGYTGASGNLNASLAARSGALQKESLGSAYIEFSVVPSTGFRFVLKSISFGVRSTSTGPQQWSLFQQEDQYSTSLAQGALSNNSSWTFVSVGGLNFSATKTISFRMYGYDGVGNPAINVANWRVDDLTIQLQVIPENLPVKWLYQRLENTRSEVIVEWATAEEQGVENFIIQRSADASHFELIATVERDSSGESPLQNRFYKYTDKAPLRGRSFYRILQRDKSGAIEYGKVLTLEQFDLRSFTLMGPLAYVPSHGEIRFSVADAGKLAVALYSSIGQLIARNEVFADGIAYSIRVGQLKPGYYILVVKPMDDFKQRGLLSRMIYIN